MFTPLFKLLPLPLEEKTDDDDSDDTEEDERGDTLNNDNKTGGPLGEVKKEKEYSLVMMMSNSSLYLLL